MQQKQQSISFSVLLFRVSSTCYSADGSITASDDTFINHRKVEREEEAVCSVQDATEIYLVIQGLFSFINEGHHKDCKSRN